MFFFFFVHMTCVLHGYQVKRMNTILGVDVSSTRPQSDTGTQSTLTTEHVVECLGVSVPLHCQTILLQEAKGTLAQGNMQRRGTDFLNTTSIVFQPATQIRKLNLRGTNRSTTMTSCIALSVSES